MNAAQASSDYAEASRRSMDAINALLRDLEARRQREREMFDELLASIRKTREALEQIK